MRLFQRIFPPNCTYNPVQTLWWPSGWRLTVKRRGSRRQKEQLLTGLTVVSPEVCLSCVCALGCHTSYMSSCGSQCKRHTAIWQYTFNMCLFLVTYLFIHLFILQSWEWNILGKSSGPQPCPHLLFLVFHFTWHTLCDSSKKIIGNTGWKDG